MADPFAHSASTLESPATEAAEVTPHDTNALATIPRALYIGGAGDVEVTLVGGDKVTFTAVPVGTILPVRAKIVHATGTTATAITAIW